MVFLRTSADSWLISAPPAPNAETFWQFHIRFRAEDPSAVLFDGKNACAMSPDSELYSVLVRDPG